MPPASQPISPSSNSSAPCTADGAGKCRCFLAPLEEAVEEGEIHIEGEDDEPLKVAKDPKLPTAEAVAIHDCTHSPYRPRCK